MDSIVFDDTNNIIIEYINGSSLIQQGETTGFVQFKVSKYLDWSNNEKSFVRDQENNQIEIFNNTGKYKEENIYNKTFDWNSFYHTIFLSHKRNL